MTGADAWNTDDTGRSIMLTSVRGSIAPTRIASRTRSVSKLRSRRTVGEVASVFLMVLTTFV